MRLLLLCVIALGCLACPPKPPPVVVIPDAQIDAAPAPAMDMAPAELPSCKTAAALKQEDICEGFFTVDNLSCARCSNVKGCVDPNIVMYCATGPCADDPACRYVADPTMRSVRKPSNGSKKPKGKR